jgi:hypothetical protein
VGVELRIELAARVVVIDREDQIAGHPILVGPAQADPGSRRGLQLRQGLVDRSPMSLDQPVVFAPVPP